MEGGVRSGWIESNSTESMSLLSVACGLMQPAQTLSYTMYINFGLSGLPSKKSHSLFSKKSTIFNLIKHI